MVDFISSLLLVRFQQNVEVHGGCHLREASIKANHDQARSHATKSQAVGHKVCKQKNKKYKNKKITRNKLESTENRENVVCMKPFGVTDVLEQ